ncbi:MAG: methyltransferase domain-containing protein [Anaerolineae bacterium]
MAQEEFLDRPMPDILAQWRHYMSLLQAEGGQSVLDVGCNTGEAERLLVREMPAIGRLVGLDYAHERCVRAMERLAADRALRGVTFVQGNGATLPFGAATFDRVLCVETLEWVQEPLHALREMQRVLRPGGTALVIHTDFGTQAFAAQDRLRCRRIVHAFSDAGPNGQIGRELYGLCREAGFRDVEPLVYPLINSEWRDDLYGYRVAHMMVNWLTEVAAVPREDLMGWLADLKEQAGRGVYYYSVNRCICRCRV